jgi:hypothetical protein
MPKPLHLTFKKEEQEIYDWLCSHSTKGGYIKDLIKADMLAHKKSSQKVMKGFLTLEE